MLLVSDDFILDLFSTINKLMDCLLFTRLYDRILTYLNQLNRYPKSSMTAAVKDAGRMDSRVVLSWSQRNTAWG